MLIISGLIILEITQRCEMLPHSVPCIYSNVRVRDCNYLGCHGGDINIDIYATCKSCDCRNSQWVKTEKKTTYKRTGDITTAYKQRKKHRKKHLFKINESIGMVLITTFC